ncbi:MAG: Hpt domain-containing protein [Balneolaceae bacterium]|nr:Hpt domain-containing protein [Balneolaceae bacterium]
MTDQQLVNLAYLEEISGGDEELIIEMIEMFLDIVPDTLSNMENLHEQKEWEDLRAQAHKLKPNMAYMGIDTGRELLQEIEKHAENGDSSEIDNKLERLNSISETAIARLREILEDLKKS